MLFYLATEPHLYTIERYLESWGSPLSGQVEPVAYESLLRTGQAKVGNYIFSDIERLSPAYCEAVAEVWKALHGASQKTVLLNNPVSSMKRYELLRSLFEQKINLFDVYRLTEVRWPVRYPVFLRPENLHLPLQADPPVLIQDREELIARIEQFRSKGQSKETWIINEYIDTSDGDGVFRKYSAFNVNGTIIARHLFFGDDWFLKTPVLSHSQHLAEELEYVETNPHQQQLKEIFALAGIDYGRIDYSLYDGRIQVWEINTNPMIATASDGGEREAVQECFSQAFNNLLGKLGFPGKKITYSMSTSTPWTA